MLSPHATPTKSQQAAALTHANQVRTARARLRGQLRQRKHDAPAVLANLLINPPSYMTTLPIGDVLAWLPGWGERTVAQVLGRHSVNPLAAITGERTTRTGCVAVLTARQRRVLADELVAD